MCVSLSCKPRTNEDASACIGDRRDIARNDLVAQFRASVDRSFSAERAADEGDGVQQLDYPDKEERAQNHAYHPGARRAISHRRVEPAEAGDGGHRLAGDELPNPGREDHEPRGEPSQNKPGDQEGDPPGPPPFSQLTPAPSVRRMMEGPQESGHAKLHVETRSQEERR